MASTQDDARISSSNEVVQLLSVMMQNIIGTITESQRQALTMQGQSMDQLRAMADSIKIIVNHSMADPSRAKILEDLGRAIKDAFEDHDKQCTNRSRSEIERHQCAMERILDFKGQGSIHALDRLEILLTNAVQQLDATQTHITTYHTNMQDTLDRLDEYGKWIKIGGISVFALGLPAILGLLSFGYYLYIKLEDMTRLASQVAK